MDDLDKDLDRRYEEMLKRCNVRMDDEDDEGEEQEIGLFCDPNIWDSKPEAGPGKGIGFERIRRITGYLVGDVSRWNNGKKAELRDRKKHA